MPYFEPWLTLGCVASTAGKELRVKGLAASFFVEGF